MFDSYDRSIIAVIKKTTYNHVFRHTFAIDLLRAGGDVFALQTLGGWEDLALPKMYSEAIQKEHALKVHEKASPVDFLLNQRKEIE